MSYFAAEQLIKTRLAEQVTVLTERQILSATDLNHVTETAQVVPALHVLYGGDVVDTGQGGSMGRGRSQKVAQNWQVLVVVRNVRDTSAEASRTDAGSLVLATLQALQGWQPSANHTPLMRVASPYRVTYRNGFAYFPLQFQTTLSVTGLT